MILGCDTVTDRTPADSCELEDAWGILESTLTQPELEILELKSWGYTADDIAAKSDCCRGLGYKAGVKKVYETLDKAKAFFSKRL